MPKFFGIGPIQLDPWGTMRPVGFIKIFKNAQLEICQLWPAHCMLRRTFTFDNFSGSQLSDWNLSINEKYTLHHFFLSVNG